MPPPLPPGDPPAPLSLVDRPRALWSRGDPLPPSPLWTALLPDGAMGGSVMGGPSSCPMEPWVDQPWVDRLRAQWSHGDPPAPLPLVDRPLAQWSHGWISHGATGGGRMEPSGLLNLLGC